MVFAGLLAVLTLCWTPRCSPASSLFSLPDVCGCFADVLLVSARPPPTGHLCTATASPCPIPCRHAVFHKYGRDFCWT